MPCVWYQTSVSLDRCILYFPVRSCAFRFRRLMIYILYTIARDFQSILDDVLAFTVAPELSMLNGSKMCTFIVWILRVQQLPADILLARKDDISSTLARAVRGIFGPQAVVDGLKVFFPRIDSLPVADPLK